MSLGPHEYCLNAICVDSKEVLRKLIIVDSVRGTIQDIISSNDERFISVLKQLETSPNYFYYDHEKLLFAGFGDIHIHAREDASGLQIYKEEVKDYQENAEIMDMIFSLGMADDVYITTATGDKNFEEGLTKEIIKFLDKVIDEYDGWIPLDELYCRFN